MCKVGFVNFLRKQEGKELIDNSSRTKSRRYLLPTNITDMECFLDLIDDVVLAGPGGEVSCELVNRAFEWCSATEEVEYAAGSTYDTGVVQETLYEACLSWDKLEDIPLEYCGL